MSKIEILYNGECPICSREIAGYQRMSEAAALPLRFDDLHGADTLARWGVTAEDAAKRLHVREPDGRIVSGVDAFIVLWRALPRLQWLARIVSVPGIYWAATKLYDHVLAPALYALHRRRAR